MKKSVLIFCLFLSGFLTSVAQTLDVFSDGALISVFSDSVFIDGNFIHQNNDTIINSGNIYLTGNWTNNNASSKVFTNGPNGWLHLSGGSDTISGITITHFNNLELSGTGVKQLINIDAEVEDTLALNDREFSAGDNTVFVLNDNSGAITRANTMTGGFVSSTNNGGLSRQTLSAVPYSFPVGSSLGTVRYRPVDLTPNSAAANIFKVRMANVNPTSESYDVNLKDTSICDVNSNFYHRIFHTAGASAADVKIYFDDIGDGSFQTIAHWQNIPQWENTNGNTFTSGSPLSSLTKAAWTDFSTNPFALARLAPAPPTILANGPTTFCEGDSVTLDAGSGFSTYLWSNGAVTPTIVVTTTGSFTVTVSNGGNCSSTATAVMNVTVNPMPTPTITSSGSTTVCLGDNVTLYAGNGYTSYLWSTNATSDSIIVDSTGNFSVTVTDAAGCSGSATSMSVTVNDPQPIILASDSTTFCQGGFITLDAGSGFTTYLWNTNETTQTIEVDATGNYYVLVTDGSGCKNDTSLSVISVTVNPKPTVSVSPDDTVIFGLSDTIFANGAVTYQWEPGNGSGSAFIISPKEETIYTVIGTDAKGCSDTATVKISVDANCVYWLPNIFSPNGDGENDELKLYGRGLEWMFLTIFDRWGNRVFETSDVTGTWDGKYKGGLLNTGVYVFILSGKCLSSGEEFEQHGNITLTR